MYSFIEIEYNQITEKGCRHLSKAIWMELEVINLSILFLNFEGNTIGDRGCQHICGGGWPKIKSVVIGIHLDNLE